MTYSKNPTFKNITPKRTTANVSIKIQAIFFNFRDLGFGTAARIW